MVFAKGERIGVADADGRGWRFLVRGAVPRLSPDGRWVAFIAPQSPARRDCPELDCLYVIEADGGPVRLLARNVDDATWSPDSRHLAVDGVMTSPPYAEVLRTVDRVTRVQHAIVVAPRLLGFDFSPDGRRLAFAMSNTPDDLRSDIYVAATDGGGVRRLTWDDRSSTPLWSPDGSIVFSHREGPLGPFCRHELCFHAWGKHRLWRMRADGSHRHVLTARLEPAVIDERLGLQAVAWSHDGRTLLAVSPTEDGDYVYAVDRSGSIRSLGPHQGYFFLGTATALSRDGRFVLLWSQLDGPDSRRTRLELVPTNGGAPHVLARNVGYPSWNG